GATVGGGSLGAKGKTRSRTGGLPDCWFFPSTFPFRACFIHVPWIAVLQPFKLLLLVFRLHRRLCAVFCAVPEISRLFAIADRGAARGQSGGADLRAEHLGLAGGPLSPAQPLDPGDGGRHRGGVRAGAVEQPVRLD